jgi:hypothetical protein
LHRDLPRAEQAEDMFYTIGCFAGRAPLLPSFMQEWKSRVDLFFLVNSLIYFLSIAHYHLYRKDAYRYFVGQSNPHLTKTQPTLANALEFMVLRSSSILESQNHAADLVAFYAELRAEANALTIEPQPSVKQHGSTQLSPARWLLPELCFISSLQSSYLSPLTSPPTRGRNTKAKASGCKVAKVKDKEAVIV